MRERVWRRGGEQLASWEISLRHDLSPGTCRLSLQIPFNHTKQLRLSSKVVESLTQVMSNVPHRRRLLRTSLKARRQRIDNFVARRGGVIASVSNTGVPRP